MKISFNPLSLAAFIFCSFFSKGYACMDSMLEVARVKGHPVFVAHSRGDRAGVMQYLDEDSSSAIAINGVGGSILYSATTGNDLEMVTKILGVLPLFTITQQKCLFETQPVVPGLKDPSLLTIIQKEAYSLDAEIKESLLNYWNALISAAKESEG